ncbi:MAG: hypothetical protein ABIP95_15165 [Pelobium sp.]
MENIKNKFLKGLVFMFSILAPQFIQAQNIQPERNDTIYLMPKTKFDSIKVKNQLLNGKATIKGTAYTKPPAMQRVIGKNNKILAQHVKITLFPMNEYFEEYLNLKKEQNVKKLKFAFMSNVAFYYRLECITNNAGEFTFSHLMPGKYYLETTIDWSQNRSYNKYVGSGSSNYGTTDYYSKQTYTEQHGDYLKGIVEVKNDGETIEFNLK